MHVLSEIDTKILFIGLASGLVVVYDLKKDILLYEFYAFDNMRVSQIFTKNLKDNQFIIVTDQIGNICISLSKSNKILGKKIFETNREAKSSIVSFEAIIIKENEFLFIFGNFCGFIFIFKISIIGELFEVNCILNRLTYLKNFLFMLETKFHPYIFYQI